MAKNKPSWLNGLWFVRRWRLYRDRKWHVDYFKKLGCTFVRSQDQLAVDSGGATGWRLSLDYVLRIFGPDVLREIADYGSAIIVCDKEEPSRTFRNRRLYLKLTTHEVADRTSFLTPQAILDAENPCRRNSIHTLIQIACVLGLNPDYISWKTGDPKNGWLY